MEFSLTRDELSASYAIIRHNIRTYRSDGVIAVVKGKPSLDQALKNLEDCQSPADRHEGWRYFFEKTDLEGGNQSRRSHSVAPGTIGKAGIRGARQRSVEYHQIEVSRINKGFGKAHPLDSRRQPSPQNLPSQECIISAVRP